MFTNAKMFNLEGSPSDHSPIFLEIKVQQKRAAKDAFDLRMRGYWSRCALRLLSTPGKITGLMQNVKQCGENLQLWGKEITGCFTKRIEECKVRLKQLRSKRDA